MEEHHLVASGENSDGSTIAMKGFDNYSIQLLNRKLLNHTDIVVQIAVCPCAYCLAKRLRPAGLGKLPDRSRGTLLPATSHSTLFLRSIRLTQLHTLCAEDSKSLRNQQSLPPERRQIALMIMANRIHVFHFVTHEQDLEKQLIDGAYDWNRREGRADVAVCCVLLCMYIQP